MNSRQRRFAPSRRPVALALAIAVIAAALPTVVAAADRSPGLAARLAHPHAGNRVIVKYEPGASRVMRARSIGQVEAASVKRASPRAKDTVVVKLKPGETVAEAMVTIGAQPGVAYVEPDYRVHKAATSDDPFYTGGNLWGMYGDATTPANTFGSGAAEAWARGFTGSGNVHVGIVDEGVMTGHEDLTANIWQNPWETANGVDDDGNGYVDDIHGWDFLNDDASVYDSANDEHGTHVAGTVGARGGNGKGVAGVNWNVSLITAKFLGPKGGTVSDAIAAIDYVTDLKLRHGLDIIAINASWSGPGYSQALLDAIERAGDAGILFVAAAGNDDLDIDSSPTYPAAYRCNKRANGSTRGWDCIISVANLEADGGLRFDSNFGDRAVDLGAPGTSIVSTHPTGYATFSGTSMAAPHVAGAAALCRSLDDARTARQIRSLIMSTGKPTTSLARRTVTGDRLDVGKLADECAPPPPTTVTTYVDDLDAEFRRFGSGWQQGITGYHQHHFWTTVRKNTRVRYATWKPVLPAAGRYTIQARIPLQHATSRKAAYRIKTEDGWVTRVRSQFKRRGNWVSLGHHDLTKYPVVQLADKTGEGNDSGRKLVFDAVRFIPFGVAPTAEDR